MSARTQKTTAMYWLKSIDVRPTSPATAIIAFGDSITDGTCSTLDAHDRWEDIVAQRMAMSSPILRSVVNEGIGCGSFSGPALVLIFLAQSRCEPKHQLYTLHFGQPIGESGIDFLFSGATMPVGQSGPSLRRARAR